MLRISRFFTIGWLLFSGCSLISQQTSAATSKAPVPKLTITEKDNGKGIDLTTGSALIVQLPSNPSTGYKWTVQGDPAPLKLQKIWFQRKGTQTDAVGEPGTDIFQLSARSVGRATLTILYRRSWEYNVPPAKTFTIQVDIR